MQSVTMPESLRDLMWFFASSLADKAIKGASGDKDEGGEVTPLVGAHPLADVMCGRTLMQTARTAFHELLMTVMLFMKRLPIDSPVIPIAIRCWSIDFQAQDRSFFHRSHIFSVISKILGKFNDEPEQAASVSDSARDVSVS